MHKNITSKSNIDKVSVIVPIFNVEKYLRVCIESLLNQSYTNIEILLVNDGSTDHSGEICDEYSRNDDRIKVVHKKNEGLMAAWITGVELSEGEYIAFVDGDDWVNTQMFKDMIDVIKIHDVDIVTCAFLKEFENYIEEVPVFVDNGLYSGNKLHDEIYSNLINVGYGHNRAIGANRWNKLIKRKLLIENIKYCDKRVTYGEDLNIVVPVALDAKSIYVMKTAYYYHYRQNPNSITNSPSYKIDLWKKCLVLNENLRKVVKEKNYYQLERQLDIDLVYMAWTSLINECRSKMPLNSIFKNMELIVKNYHVIKGCKLLDRKKMSSKELIVMFLIRFKCIKLFYILQKTSTRV